MGEQKFTMKSEVVGRPVALSDDLVQSVEQINCERRLFAISELSCEFPQISRTLLYSLSVAFVGGGRAADRAPARFARQSVLTGGLGEGSSRLQERPR
jgi:hypothetical protein